MERLQRLLTETTIFDYFRDKDNVYGQLRDAVYKITIDSLDSGLTDYQSKFLCHTHWHQPDPNDEKTGSMQSLIKTMLEDACFYGMSSPELPLETEFYVMGDLERYTGLKSEDELVNVITEINTLWQNKKIASLGYKDGKIIFELSLKPQKTK